MTIYQVAWNEKTKVALIQLAGDEPPTGYVVAGTFENDLLVVEPGVTYKEGDPVHYHVHDVLKRKLGIEDLPGIKIKLSP